ncbi:hypothetical protein ACQ4PT_070278 [Festuca glaucescens]
MGRGGANWNQGRGDQFVPPQRQGPGFRPYQDFQEGYGYGRGAQFLPDPRDMFPQSELWMSGRGTSGAMKVKVLQWHAVASWTWDAQDETCGICRMAFDGCCPDCKFPGDDCPIIWGACNHAFHLHCILKWVNSQTSTPLCPMCRREWQFKG